MIAVQRYDDVYQAVTNNRSWRLVLGAGQPPIRFNGILAGLRA